MPEEGIDYLERSELLTYEEMVRLINTLVGIGIEKLRITGGEPFLRKDMMDFLGMVSTSGLKEFHITTNGTLTYDHIPALKEMGVTSINLSLDTLDRNRFHEITRRDDFDLVMRTFHRLLEYGIKTKINMVVMSGKNTQDIIAMANLAKEYPVSVRYIEEMPFNGSGKSEPDIAWNHLRIHEELRSAFPTLTALKPKSGATATSYEVEGFAGTLGIIAAYSRTFCGTCNRLRITPQGMLRTCLYDEGVFNIKDLMRKGASDRQLQDAVIQSVGMRSVDGFEAEKKRWNQISESMSTIGG